MTFLLETLRLGLNNLRLHKLRTFLTSLGIILGVAAIIVVVAIGEGNKRAALRQIQALGATNIILRSQPLPETSSMGGEERSFVARYGLTRLDLRRLEHTTRDVASIVPLKTVGAEISHLSSRTASQTFGTTPALLEVANLRLARGRYLTDQDLASHAPVAVIGSEVAKRFFTLRDPLGSELRIDQQVFRIVGVLEPVGLAGGAGGALVGRDLNNDVHIPITTAESHFGDMVLRRASGSMSAEEVELSEMYVTAQSTDQVIELADRIERVIEVAHPELRDVEVVVPWELLEAAKKTMLVWNVMLIFVAAISLLVGGIGIMNIMLATVTERTREIGIRRALGATRQHIIAQFLVETGSLSAVGGLLGIAVGVGVAVVIPSAVRWILELPIMRFLESPPQVETSITAWSIAVSFIVAASVGIIFGLYPAMMASQKDPVVALRHD